MHNSRSPIPKVKIGLSKWKLQSSVSTSTNTNKEIPLHKKQKIKKKTFKPEETIRALLQEHYSDEDVDDEEEEARQKKNILVLYVTIFLKFIYLVTLPYSMLPL